jgi:serine/threonine protein kinase
VKLADFGFAKTLEQGASLAESFCGTLDFIAPERIVGMFVSCVLFVWVLFMWVCCLCVGVLFVCGCVVGGYVVCVC